MIFSYLSQFHLETSIGLPVHKLAFCITATDVTIMLRYTGADPGFFKDKFWMDKEVKYEFTADLSGSAMMLCGWGVKAFRVRRSQGEAWA